MTTLITAVHVFACIFLILTVLLQAGKGGGVGVALGGQTSAQVFGGRGAGTFLERLTAGTAIVFMVTSMSLAYFASQSDSARLQRIAVEQAAKKKVADQKAADDKAQKDAEDRAKKEHGDEPPATTPAPATEETAPPTPTPKTEAAPVPKAAPAPKKAEPRKRAAPAEKTEEPAAPAEPEPAQ